MVVLRAEVFRRLSFDVIVSSTGIALSYILSRHRGLTAYVKNRDIIEYLNVSGYKSIDFTLINNAVRENKVIVDLRNRLWIYDGYIKTTKRIKHVFRRC